MREKREGERRRERENTEEKERENERENENEMGVMQQNWQQQIRGNAAEMRRHRK